VDKRFVLPINTERYAGGSVRSGQGHTYYTDERIGTYEDNFPWSSRLWVGPRTNLPLRYHVEEIISVGFDVIDQLLIRFFAFVRYWRKNGSTMRQYISYS
jgi:hypothetical protein